MTDAVREYREAKLDPELDAGDIMGYADAAIAELQDKLDRAQEYARIEVKRKGEAVERECAAIERAEKAEAERDAAVRERDIWRDMYRHSVRPVCGSEMAYEAQMKYDREASRARLYTKQRREETWADSPPIETEDGYV